MEVFYTDQFRKQFSKLPPKVQKKFAERVSVFMKHPGHPLLRNHPLKGLLAGYRAFSVTGNYRVIFKFTTKTSAKLIDIGTHSQVY